MAQEPHPPFGNEETMEVSRGELKKELARQTPLSHLADRSKKFTPLPSSSSSPPVEDPLLRLKSLVDKYKQEDHPKTLPSPLPPQQSFLPSRPSSLYSPFSTPPKPQTPPATPFDYKSRREDPPKKG